MAQPGSLHGHASPDTRAHAGDVGSSTGDDCPAVGRPFQQPKPSSVSPMGSGSFSNRAPTRSSRPPVPSPLSTPSYGPSFSTKANPPEPNSASSQRQSPAIDPISRGDTTPPSAGCAATLGGSSAPSSPEAEGPDLNSPVALHAAQSVSQPVITGPSAGSNLASKKSAMASPTTAATQQGGAASGMPRNSSIDSAISAISPHPQPSSPPNSSGDMTKLIKTAGSPEAVIQYLLKEKHSQAQQNSQLWRLVDKQRAMIMGLNKDLETSLKDKERYRKKLKEMMADPAIMKAAGGQHGGNHAHGRRNVPGPHAETDSPKDPMRSPDPPKLDTDGRKASPIDAVLAPCPITPPADQTQASPSAVGELLIPTRATPQSQERTADQFGHEAEAGAADKVWKERAREQPREIPFDPSPPPSRILPSDPPKIPPPKPPAAHSPLAVTVMQPSPQQPDEGVAKFPSSPRKAPPPPLQLRLAVRRQLEPPSVDEEADTDYDHLSGADKIVAHEKRGRRRTREEDDREREILAIQEAEARSASKKSKSSKGASPGANIPPSHPDMPPPNMPQEMAPASLDAVLHRGNTRGLAAPLMSPGLPASPRPFGNVKMSLASPPMPSRGAPLSPRPPRQAIPLPPNTPLVSPPSVSSGETTAPVQSLNVAKKVIGVSQPSTNWSSPTDRTRIYKGLVTEGYPDLLLPPNALPSIYVKVASSRMKPSRASLMSLTQLEEDPVFTLAIIARADGSELWRVEKDSTSLAKLDQRLKQCKEVMARPPDRALFSGHAPAKLDARRLALDQYMDELLNTPLDTATAAELCKYLSTNTLPPNADETGHATRLNVESTTTRPDSRPTRSGYLTKKGKNFGGWKSRFFVLDGPHLKYYETPGGAHLGTIKLQNAQIGKQSQSSDANSPAHQAIDEELDSQYRHAFLILEPKKKDSSSHVKHVLCAESDKERDVWVESLLQWFDSQNPYEEPSHSAKSNAYDGQMVGEQTSSGGRLKKPKSHQASGSDTLIGVRYDSTYAGDAPQTIHGGGRPKTSGGFPEHHVGADSQLKVISGPKDPQLISDAAAWGNRPGTAPTNDEKKQRKRSFFGFGPKARSSSDGQESMGSESVSGATPPQNAYYGPVRHVFGAPLAEGVRYNPPMDVDVPLPSVVYRCIQYLESQDAVLEEGIFRLSGSNVVIKQLRERFNTEGDINLVTDEQYYDIHAVASLLKLYLRELPTTILTRELHLDFLQTTELIDKREKLAALSELAQKLPQANATLLKYLIAFLIRIINHADVNKMTVRNVGIVFSPTLNIPAPVFAVLLQNYESIFGIDPEEYELPTPVLEPESRPKPRFEIPDRPSTSSGSASPQRQAWMESMREQTRSSPTPPLLMNLNAARGSPTPSGASRQSYEPSHLIHQSPRAGG